MHYIAFPDLQYREDLLCDAVAAIDKTIPTSTSAGTTLGALFPSWPRAAKLLASARLHCTQLANSRKALEAFTASLARAMVLIKKLDHTVLTRAPSHSADALKALQGLSTSFTKDLQECLVEFAPTSSSACVAEPVSQWSWCLHQAWAETLNPICNKDLDSSALEAWVRTTGDTRCMLTDCANTTEECSCLFGDKKLMNSIMSLRSITNLLKLSSEMCGKSELSAEEARRWQALFQSSFKPWPVAIDGWKTADAIMCLSECPLFAPSGLLLTKIAKPLHAEGAEAVAKLKEAVGAALTPLGGNSFLSWGTRSRLRL